MAEYKEPASEAESDGRLTLYTIGHSNHLGSCAKDLNRRLGIQELNLAIGLSRPYEGRCWPMVIGVHTVPDLQVAVDYQDL